MRFNGVSSVFKGVIYDSYSGIDKSMFFKAHFNQTPSNISPTDQELISKVVEHKDNFFNFQQKNFPEGARGVPRFFWGGHYLLFCEYKPPAKFHNCN